jgi:hypothetical protein
MFFKNKSFKILVGVYINIPIKSVLQQMVEKLVYYPNFILDLYKVIPRGSIVQG